MVDLKEKEPRAMANTEHIFSKLLNDSTFRIKFIRTLCVLLSYTTLGVLNSNLGPALTDIQLLTGESLDVISWLFTATYAGSLIGTLICGPICDRVGPQLVLFVSVFTASCLTGVFIYSSNFTAMIIVRVVTGIFIGGVDIGGISSVAELWRTEARPYLHALQCMTAIGGIVTPFIIQPFLAPNMQLDSRRHVNDSNHLFRSNTTSNFTDNSRKPERFTNIVTPDLDYLLEGAKVSAPVSEDCENITVGCLNTLSTETLIGETKIQYAFIIFAISGVVASVSLLAFVITDCRDKQNTNRKTSVTDNVVVNRTKYKLTRNIKLVILGLITSQSYLTAALGIKVYAFLPTFFVIQFDWSTSTASVAISGFWIGKAVFRFVGLFLSTKLKQSQMIPCFSVIYIFSSVCLTVAAMYSINALAWVVTVTLGVGLSVLRSCLFVMTEEKVIHMSGRVASLYVVFFVLGGMVDPLYTGYLMDNLSPMWFAYLLIFESALFLMLFVLVKIILLKFGNQPETSFHVESQAMTSEKAM